MCSTRETVEPRGKTREGALLEEERRREQRDEERECQRQKTREVRD